MALSDDERRTLEALEAQLAQDDPKLATTLSGRPRLIVAHRSAALGLLGLALGLALLVLGISTFFLVSLVGFAAMLVGALALIGSVHRAEDEPQQHAVATPSLDDVRFADIIEQQWRRAHPETRHPED